VNPAPAENTIERSTARVTISFIVPAYNEEAELPGTLSAICSAAAGYQHEVVLVNDGSSDATAAIGEEFGARVISIQRRQIAAARNAGAAAARGLVFIFVDADTRIRPEHVRGALRALENGCAGGGAWLATDREIPRWGRIFFRVFTVLYFGLNLGAGAFLFTTRENFFAAGGFDEIYFAGEEVFFTIALKQLGRFRLLPEPVMTSGRKLRMYSGWKIFTRSLSIIFGGPRGVMSRKKLDMWYSGDREGPVRKEMI
jgi:glycosyltransferase involved in cell wall biosynthesis